MNKNPADDVIRAIRALYNQNPIAQQLFDVNAQRERDATTSSLDVISRKLEISPGRRGCACERVGSRRMWGF